MSAVKRKEPQSASGLEAPTKKFKSDKAAGDRSKANRENIAPKSVFDGMYPYA